MLPIGSFRSDRNPAPDQYREFALVNCSMSLFGSCARVLLRFVAAVLRGPAFH
jgi:hypothetical protein